MEEVVKFFFDIARIIANKLCRTLSTQVLQNNFKAPFNTSIVKQLELILTWKVLMCTIPTIEMYYGIRQDIVEAIGDPCATTYISFPFTYLQKLIQSSNIGLHHHHCRLSPQYPTLTMIPVLVQPCFLSHTYKF